MDHKEIDINTRNWVALAQDRELLENPCECGIEPPGSINHGVRVGTHPTHLFTLITLI